MTGEGLHHDRERRERGKRVIYGVTNVPIDMKETILTPSQFNA